MKKIFIGIDLGGTKIFTCVLALNIKFKILGKAKQSTKSWEGRDKVFDSIEETVNAALAQANISLKDVEAIGIGVPGAVDVNKGTILFASNLGWKNINLKKELEKRFKIPVFLNNDVNLGTLAEQKIGAAKEVQNVVGVYWGTGCLLYTSPSPRD